MSDETMTLEQALRTSLEYEERVRDLYREAAAAATEDVGRKLFTLMGDEEQGHLDYLTSRLDEWGSTGAFQATELTTLLPAKEILAHGKADLAKAVEGKDWSTELQFLEQARDLEEKTGRFYKKMVAELPLQGRQLFQQFLEIEDGHYDIVQAQIDALTGNGFWFDFMEFSLEGG